MTPRQIIIQAGGRGTRLEQYTSNKPKCLVPVDGKPLLEHTLAAFPGAFPVIILDYRDDVVLRWLDAFPPDREYLLVKGKGMGSAAGIADAARVLPYPNEPVAVVWCDLVFEKPPFLADALDGLLVFTTKEFPCRFTVGSDGVAGLFQLSDARALTSVPSEGEFVEWVLGQHFFVGHLCNVREYGTLAALEDHWCDTPSRYFNEVTIAGETVTKRSRFPEHQHLIDDEAAWYRHVRREDFGNIPRLISHSAGEITLGRLSGQHPWQMEPDTRALAGIMDALERLHRLGEMPFDEGAIGEMYQLKPINRALPVAKLLPPELHRPFIAVNGKRCRNFILGGGWGFEATTTPFRLIHGDPTFSNILIAPGGFPFFIDPRGRFGSVQFYGDPLYDWAKLWYSVVGGYDNFNRHQFTLEMGDGWADVRIKPSRWAGMAGMFEDRLGAEVVRKVRIIHGLIWLSLVGVCRDYDQMLAAYFQGLLVLEEVLS